jgi:hypothetical protein
MKAIKYLLICVFVFNLTACSQRPVITFEVFTPTIPITPTPPVGADITLESPTPFVENQTELPTFLPPTPVPGIVEKPTDFSPVLYGQKYDANTFFLLLGGVSKDAWLAPGISVERFAGKATYALHTFKNVNQYFFWGTLPEIRPTCRAYTIGTDIDVYEPGMVATLDGWGVTKGAVTELSADGQFYQQTVLDWLTAEGVTEPQLGTLQVFRVDVEGDGTDEIFISATHLDDSQHTTKAGDYSIVLMRKVAGNDAMTIPLVADFYISKELEITYPRTYFLANFIDLNQDGILEVVVGIQKWEGFGAVVYQIDEQNVTEALRAEC